MDDGKKQRLIMAGLTVFSLGAGSYFLFSGKSGPPPDCRKTEVDGRETRPVAAPDDKPRSRRVTHMQKPVAPPRRARQGPEQRTETSKKRSQGRRAHHQPKRKKPQGL